MRVKKLLLGLLLVALLLTAGCIKGTMVEKVKENGKADVEVKLNMSGYIKYEKRVGKSEEEIKKDLEESCKKEEKEKGAKVICNFDMKKEELVMKMEDVELSKLNQRLEEESIFLGKRYTLRWKVEENDLNPLIELRRIIVMPGKVISSNYGKVEGNKVIIEQDELEKGEVVIVSEKNLINTLCPLAGILFIPIIGMLKKK